MKFSTILFFVGLIFIFFGIAFGLNLFSDSREISPINIPTSTPTIVSSDQEAIILPDVSTDEPDINQEEARDSDEQNQDEEVPYLNLPTSTPSPSPQGGGGNGQVATAVPYSMPSGQNNEILGFHVVQPLESFSCIGKSYGVSPSAIAAENGYFLTDMLPVGVTLRIPNVPFMANAGIKTCFPQFIVKVDFPTPTSTPNPTITSTPQPKKSEVIDTEERLIEVEVPQNMFLGESLYVELLYFPQSKADEVEELKSAYQINVTVAEVDTTERYGDPVKDNLGIVEFYDDQTLYATAGLEGAGFEISPSATSRQVVTEDRALTWLWSIKPTEVENQTLVVSLDLDYEPIAPSMNLVESPPTWSKPLIISVRSTHMGLRQRDLETFAVLSTLIGLFLSGYKVLEVFGFVSKPSGE